MNHLFKILAQMQARCWPLGSGKGNPSKCYSLSRSNLRIAYVLGLGILLGCPPSLVAYENCITSNWVVPCPWNRDLDVHGSTRHCVYRSEKPSKTNTEIKEDGSTSAGASLGGGTLNFLIGWGGGGSTSLDSEVCAPSAPQDPDQPPCAEPKITENQNECDKTCNEPEHAESAGSSVDLWGLQYYDRYNDLKVAVPGGWLSTSRTYSRGAWRMDGTNYLEPEAPAAGGLQRISMSGRIFTQIAPEATTYTSGNYIIEASEDASNWQNSWLLLTEPDGTWFRYRGMVATGALLEESGFKQNTYLIYQYDWHNYPNKPLEALRLLEVASGLEMQSGTPKVLLTYTYAPTDFNWAGKDYPLLTAIHDATAGLSVAYEYTADGLLKTVKKVDGTRSEYSYDADRNLRMKTEYDRHSGGQALKSCTIDYLPTKLTQADAVETRFMLGALAGPPKRVAYVTNGAGITKRFSGAYNENSGGYYSKVSYSNGLVKELWLDDAGELVQRTLNGQTVYNRVAVGRVERITTRGNSVTINEYDEFDHLIRTTSPSGHVQSWTYAGDLDRMASAIDALGVLSTYTYDDDLSDNNDPARFEPTIKAAPYNAIRSEATTTTSKDGALTRTTYTYYDALERQVLEINARGHASAYQYHGNTRLIAQAQRLDIPGGHTRYTQTFDPRGYLQTRTDANGATTSYVYDPVGRLLEMTDALQQTTRYTYSGDDRVQMEAGITPTHPNGRITRYAYDGDGRQTQVIRVDAAGTEHVYMQYAYDAEGRLAASTDADGLLTTYTYDLYGNRRETRQPLPAAQVGPTSATHANTLQEWNAYGDLLQTTTPAGLVTTYTYDKEGRVLTATEGVGTPGERGIRYRYDALGNLTETTYQLSNGTTGTTVNTYDGWGRLSSRSGYGVYTEHYSYDLNGNLQTLTNARGLVTEYSYDAFDRIDQIKQDGTLIASRHYDANGNLIKTINGEGEQQHFAYDALNRQIFQSIPLLSGTSLPATWWSDFANVALSQTFNRFGEVETTRAAHGQLTTNTYDAFGRLDSITSPTGDTIGYTYSAADRVQRIRFPVVSTSAQLFASEIAYTYDPANPSILVSETTRTGESFSYAYDPALRRARIDLPTGAVTGYTFDAFSRLAEQHEYESAAAYAAGTVYRTTEYRAYDDFDRLLELTLPAGEGTQYSEYDDKGKLLMRYGLEADGSTQGANTYPTLYSYDATGNLSTLTTYQGGIDQASSSPSVTTWEYDLRGRLQRKSYPDAGEITYTYYANDRLKTRRNARQQLTTYTYDAWGNPERIDYAAAAETDITFSYVKGRRDSMSDAGGSTRWTYHSSTGLPASETRTPLVGDPTILAWEYDAAGRRVRMTVDGLPATHQAGTWQTIYNYDRYGRLQRVQDDRAHSSTPFTYSYAAGSGLLEQIDSPWRTGAGADPYLRQTRRYDTFGRLTDIATRNSTDTVSQALSDITYDPLDRRTSLSLLGGTLYASQQSRAYQYDPYGQLKQEQTDTAITQAYQYDPIGNRLNRWQGDPAVTDPTTYTPNPVNQYSSITPAQSSPYAPLHDADGNLTNDADWSYTWNSENQLIGMEPLGDPVAGDQKLTFSYDGLGRRVRKQVYEWDISSGTYLLTADWLFVYDGWNMIAEVAQKDLQTAPFTRLTSYTWGLDLSGSLQGAGVVGGLLAVAATNSSGTLTYMPAYDFNGNVTGYFDTSTETLVAEFEYGPFGELIRETGAKKDAFNFRFSTKYEDAETGLLYYGYRYYNAETGRWLNRDPLGERGGLNIYGFVGNDPLNQLDYLGLSPFTDDLWDIANQYSENVHNLAYGAIIKAPMSVYEGITGAYDMAKFFASPEGREFLQLLKDDPCFREKLKEQLGDQFDELIAKLLTQEGFFQAYGELGTGIVSGVALAKALKAFKAFKAAEKATNKTVGLSDDIAATFKNGNATRVVLDKPLTVSRFHGGKSGQIGRFASGDAFNSRRAVRQRLALKQEWGNRISKQSDVTLPEGTVIWRGQAAPQLQKNGKLLRGGGDQIWIESDLNPAWFNNTAHFK